MHFLCISSTCNFANSRVPKNRQTENLGDFDGFQPSRMPTFQILRFAKIEINPCNSTSNTGTKKAEWRVTIRHQDKKMVVHSATGIFAGKGMGFSGISLQTMQGDDHG